MTPIDSGLLAFEQAQRLLFEHNGLETDDVARTASMLAHGSSIADIYFEVGEAESWSLEDQKVSQGNFSQFQGLGIRSVVGDEASFAYSGEISPEALRLTSDAVTSMRRLAQTGAYEIAQFSVAPRKRDSLYGASNPLETSTELSRIGLLQDVDLIARSMDSRIVRVGASLQTSYKTVLIATGDGRLAADIRPGMQLVVTVIAEKDGRRGSGSGSVGGRYGLDGIDEDRLRTAITDAVRIATTNLESRPAPAGVMSVVLGPGFPGVLLHEAVGHGLEGDAHRKRSSVFVDQMGSLIAAHGVTVIDDGAMAARLGSLNTDDEGEPTRETVLIENGRLSGLMQDRLNAGLMNQRTTGNARRQSYAHLPMPRMTNTYLAAGQDDPGDIIRSVKRGLYAVSFGGGTVDVTSGQFNFSATEAYLIEDGRITAPVSGATLIGLGHEALKRVVMVGNDLRLDNGQCGKAGQSVAVCVGQPTVRVDDMVVGGTA
jgi:TldD protein